MNNIDTFPATAEPPKPFVYKAMDDVPMILADQKPSHDGQVSIVASQLAGKLQGRGHLLAASQWAIHQMIKDGLLTTAVVTFDLPMTITQKVVGFRHLGGASRIVSETFGGGEAKANIPTNRPVPFENFKVIATQLLWKWWNQRADH